MKKLLLVSSIIMMSAGFASAQTLPSFYIGAASAGATVTQNLTQSGGRYNQAGQWAQVVQNSPNFVGVGSTRVRIGAATANATVSQALTQTNGYRNTATQNALVIQNSPTWTPAP